MDYQNRAGSKKGTGGIASDAQQNLQRRKQVNDLLSQGEEVPFTFQDEQDEFKLRKNPDIYRNHSGKLVCKLCNTMHVSWTSVERHVTGKKHHLNVLKRGGTGMQHSKQLTTSKEQQFQDEVQKLRSEIKHNGVKPDLQVIKVKDSKRELPGIVAKVKYQKDKRLGSEEDIDFMPYIRIMSSMELTESKTTDSKYLVIAFEPFENIAVELPDVEIVPNDYDGVKEDLLVPDDLNRKCTYWDKDNYEFYIQLFFRHN